MISAQAACLTLLLIAAMCWVYRRGYRIGFDDGMRHERSEDHND